MSRVSKDEAFMAVAYVMSARGTCARRKVGCVLVDDHSHIIGTGYNGAPRGAPHCYEFGCSGVGHGQGLGLDHCEAIHAEQNALLQCRNPMNIHACYTTTFPCITCFKLLANTSCRHIIYDQTYTSHQNAVRDLNEKLQSPMEIHRYVANAAEPVYAGGDLAELISRYITGLEGRETDRL